MGVYDRQIASVKRLIKKYGQSVVLQSKAIVIPDVNKPWKTTSNTPVNAIVDMLFLSPTATGDSQIGKELLQYLGKTEVLSGVLRGYMASGSVIPTTSHIVLREGETLRIKAVDTLKPNNQVIMHILEFEL